MKDTQNSKVKKKKPGETPARPFPQGLGGRCRAASRGGRQQPQGAWGRADQRAGHVGTQRTQPPAASHGDAAGHRPGLNTLDAAPAPSAGTALGHDPDARGPHRRRQQRRLPHQPETPQRPPKEQSCREHARATRTAGPPSARGAPLAPRASPAGAARSGQRVDSGCARGRRPFRAVPWGRPGPGARGASIWKASPAVLRAGLPATALRSASLVARRDASRLTAPSPRSSNHAVRCAGSRSSRREVSRHSN